MSLDWNWHFRAFLSSFLGPLKPAVQHSTEQHRIANIVQQEIAGKTLIEQLLAFESLMRITFSRFPSLFLRRDLIRHHHLVFIRHTVTQPTVTHPPPRQRSMRRLRIHPSLQLKVRKQNRRRTVSNQFIFISDRNYLGDSPQNISPKITPQESPPNIYSAGIHQVCGDLETLSPFSFTKKLSSNTGERWWNNLLLLAGAASDDI